MKTKHTTMYEGISMKRREKKIWLFEFDFFDQKRKAFVYAENTSKALAWLTMETTSSGWILKNTYDPINYIKSENGGHVYIINLEKK